MGKVTGFIEFDRRVESYRSVNSRIKDYDEIFSGKHDAEHLQQQGARCMDCGVPFCQSTNGCPIENLIPEWNHLVYTNNWREALNRLNKTNNFPEFTGRVCPAPCEGSCVLGINDSVVAIKNIEQSIIDKGFEEGWIKARKVIKRSGKKIAIIGSGPAGLTAADELNQMGHLVTVYERSDRVGGLLMYGIPNMKLSKDIVNRRIDILKAEGIKFITNVDIGKDISIANLQEKFDCVVLATGSTKANDVNVDNRDAKGIYFAMDYLKANYKSLLDLGHVNNAEFNAKDKDVIVIGGGDTGTDCIGTAIRQGAKSIVNFELMQKLPTKRSATNPWPDWPLIYRVDYGHEEAKQVFGKDPRQYQLLTKSFIKDSNGNVSGINTINVEFRGGKLKEIAGSEKVWNAQLVLLSIGFSSPEHYVSEDAGIELDKFGNYKADDNIYQSSKNGIFTAGDCRRGQSLVVWAIREGRGVASSVDNYLTKN